MRLLLAPTRRVEFGRRGGGDELMVEADGGKHRQNHRIEHTLPENEAVSSWRESGETGLVKTIAQK